MKSKMNIMVAAILVMLSGITLLLVRGRKPTIVAASTPAVISDVPALPIQTEALPALTTPAPQLQAPAPAPVAPISADIPTDIPVVNVPTLQVEPALPKSNRVLKYIARSGDSVSGMAAGFLGGNSKINRDAIINENQSLQNNPNLVVAGKTYTIPGDNGLSAAPAPAAVKSSLPATQPDADDLVRMGTGPDLRYTAVAGDTLSKLAKVLLGSDTQAARDAIVNNNASLKIDPDRVVAGQTYWIPAPFAAVE